MKGEEALVTAKYISEIESWEELLFVEDLILVRRRVLCQKIKSRLRLGDRVIVSIGGTNIEGKINSKDLTICIIEDDNGKLYVIDYLYIKKI